MPNEFTLLCVACRKRKKVPIDMKINGKPVLDWWEYDCRRLCRACR